MFKSALLKLTLTYLVIIMAISLFFSVVLYQVSVREISINLEHQRNMLGRKPTLMDILNQPEILAEKEQLLVEGRDRITGNLIYTNLAILILAGAASYFFARKTLEPIEEIHEQQKRFTADASHELRSPLAVMKTEIEVALRNPKLSQEESLELLKSNLEEVEKLKGLTEGLLDLARDNGKNLAKGSIEVFELAEATKKRLAKKAAAKEIMINNLEKSLRGWGNPEQIGQVIEILLENAIKYSPPGKEVTLSGKQLGKTLKITVADQGLGISKENLERIFDRFFRVDDSRTKNNVPGYGLGLSIAKKIVTSNSGIIEVKSVLGKGSIFTITIPSCKL